MARYLQDDTLPKFCDSTDHATLNECEPAKFPLFYGSI